MGPITPTAVIDLVTVVFVLATMFSMGLALTTAEVLEAIGRRRLMAKSLLVNLILVPLLAFAFVLAVPMETGHVIGLLLIAMAPGAPFGPKLAEISKSDVAFASGLMAVLGVVSVATIPITVALLMPGDVAADPLGIARIVVVTQLVPLIGGLGVRARYQPVATRLHPPIQRLSTYLLVLLVVLLTVLYAGEMRQLVGTGTLFISVVVVVGSLLLGYALGGPEKSTREVLATTTAARNVAIALLIATTSFRDPGVLTITVAFGLVSLVVSGPVASLWGRPDEA
ncbi:bile acid:Na+ symporter, BASS family [Halorubrum aquaticum]|uniref:Bile acid:Na+ symporter, BASS family n=1 Tax=Halorubrum aquaticum TaxID=387340 RepID=A0A1I2ZH12_9EURY|nr:bile acid:sodium symporter [Halorubrum aquaticum]SFH37108.1 bile acid:Na+ symporter, BASS family [Halorubrum aquaticum]